MNNRFAVTFLWLSLAIFSGIGMYIIKYEVQKLETELAMLDENTKKDQEAIHVLKAEWSHLNNPERIRKLSDRYIKLQPVEPSQIIDIADLPFRDSKSKTYLADTNEAEINKKLKKMVSTRE